MDRALGRLFRTRGDLLIGTVIAARLHETKRVDLDFGAFVDHPVLKDLAAFVDETRPRSVEHGLSEAAGEPE